MKCLDEKGDETVTKGRDKLHLTRSCDSVIVMSHRDKRSSIGMGRDSEGNTALHVAFTSKTHKWGVSVTTLRSPDRPGPLKLHTCSE